MPPRPTPSQPRLGLSLTPRGRLGLDRSADAPAVEDALADRLAAAFDQGAGPGLLQLGAAEVGRTLPPQLAWWRDFAARYIDAVCHRVPAEPAGDQAAPALPEVPPPGDAELATLVLTAPPMPGAEYLDAAVLRWLWQDLGAALAAHHAASGSDLETVLKALNPAWNLVGRVHFNLAEHRQDPEAPFAFLATYTVGLTAGGRPRHAPLGEALEHYAGADRRDALLSLLLPVQRAAESCDWLRVMVARGEIYHPLRWTPAEATRLLSSAPSLERAGVIVRMPPAWHAGRPSRPQVTATVGARPPSGTGLEGLLDFRVEVSLDGEPLDADELEALLAGTDGLVLLRGQWVEVDRDRLDRAVRQLREAEALAARDGVSFAEAMRLLAGTAPAVAEDDAAVADWSRVTAGPWLAETLARLRAPTAAEGRADGAIPGLQATLRPYQRDGVAWLHLLTGLGFGACLADDMGLGKTLQVLALLARLRAARPPDAPPARPSLIVAPASLLANWAAEIAHFAPTLGVKTLHPSALPAAKLKALSPDALDGTDLAITSYGTLLRLPLLAETGWDLIVFDEAQALRSPGAKQTKAAKGLTARARIALTGTPVENRLGDLWSLFDVINPGLLGSAREFTRLTKRLAERADASYAPLRELVRPYILRRMKTDRAVIADLPDKTEVTAWCPLSKKQAALYSRTVTELRETLSTTDGIQRRGVVLATMMRLKQICNHPSHWLGDDRWDEADSGKLIRLREIAETVAARQDKMLVFTQFREVTQPLAAFLGQVFGRPGLVLHGGTAVRTRQSLVARFQDDETVPFFVLSLKAGGTGLTLTAASHVVHYDRWWNPAVEAQATDRAFRIGQHRNVLVHKFVCRGTVEERIDALIEEKKALAAELFTGDDEVALTELDDRALLEMLALDVSTALKD